MTLTESEAQEIIEEIDLMYNRIGRITYYNQSVPQRTWDVTTQASLASHMKRCDELTKMISDAGYEYDWFKGWTREMVTTPA